MKMVAWAPVVLFALARVLKYFSSSASVFRCVPSPAPVSVFVT